VGEAEQLAMARRLLLDPESEDEHWMLDWVAPFCVKLTRVGYGSGSFMYHRDIPSM